MSTEQKDSLINGEAGGYFRNDTNSMKNVILQGDAFERMKDIPDGAVDMVLSDPPYSEATHKGADRWKVYFEFSIV
jgi:DNA modification methylase